VRIEFGGKSALRELKIFAGEVGFSIGWKQETLEDAIYVLEDFGAGKRAAKA